MRILFLLTQDLESPSGLGRYWPLAKGLSRLGHQVSIAALHSNFDELEETRSQIEGVDVHYVAPMHVIKKGDQKSYYSTSQLLGITLRATRALSVAAWRTPADIIYIGKPHPMNSIAGLLVKILRRKPIFVDCDDYEAGSGRFGGKWQQKVIEFFEKRVPRFATNITTHTHFMRDNLISWGIPKDKITYLPNGVDPDRFMPLDETRVEAIRSQLAIVGKKVIAYIGSLSQPSHPVNLLLDAFAEIQAQFPDTRLLIVGGGENMDDLKQQAVDFGIRDYTHFVGRVPPADISLYYALADVSVDPVHDNPAARGRSPLKLFESWISEVPFVTADVGDRAFLMGDPPAGVLVKPGQKSSLAKGIETILTDSQLASQVIASGKIRVKNYYWDVLAQQLNQLFIGTK